MKSISRKFLVAAASAASLFALPFVGGCESDHHHGHYGASVGVRETYVYEPGYYYDREYYEPGGRYHNRSYWYYDGRRWDHRDGIPSGYTARERHLAHERHERHARHDAHWDRNHDWD